MVRVHTTTGDSAGGSERNLAIRCPRGLRCIHIKPSHSWSEVMTDQSDHDALIRLSSTLEAHSQRESEISRATLSEVSRMSTKLDQLRESYQETTRDIKDIMVRLRDDDIRIATLENQIDALQDISEKAVAVSEAESRSNDRRIKTWTVCSGLVAFALANGPTILMWLSRIFT